MSLRILNLSDIHFKKMYAKDKVVEKFFASFQAAVAAAHAEKRIDLVILNGDISFSGQAEEYKAFDHMLKKHLPEDIPVASIVGNHDVSWDYVSLALHEGNRDSMEINLSNVFSTASGNIHEDIKKEDSKFKKAFVNYFQNFESEQSELVRSRFEYEFDDEYYCGYLFDKENKVIIMLLNSAFFSFGAGIMKSLYNELVKEKSDKEMKAYAEHLITGGSSQNGKQSYLLSAYKYHERLKEIELDPDVRRVTIVHHPPSWVLYKEQFEPTVGHNLHLDKLYEVSDLIVTGHLHAPVTSPNIIADNCYHFSTGAFMEYSYIDPYISKPNSADPKVAFPNNWFVIMDIDKYGFSCIPYKLTTKDEGGIANHSMTWNMLPKHTYDFIKKGRTTSPAPMKAFVRNRVSRYEPKNINGLIDILKKKRHNDFHLIGDSTEIRNHSPSKLNFNNNIYLVYVNSIEKFQEIFAGENIGFADLMKKEMFKELIDNLSAYPEDELPVVAFYEFFITNDPQASENRIEFQRLEFERFVQFQAFKHQFYNGVKELLRYKEISIVFDCFLQYP